MKRKDGRVVECIALEMRRRGNLTGGSNPSLSANKWYLYSAVLDNCLIVKHFLLLLIVRICPILITISAQ